MSANLTTEPTGETLPRRKGRIRRVLRWVFYLIIVLVGAFAIYAWATGARQDRIETGDPHMKAVVYTNYGSPDVLEIRDVKKPVPNDDQVLVKVRAASLNPLDWHYMEGTPYIMRAMGTGLRKPKSPRLGVDLAGQVEAVGKNVKMVRSLGADHVIDYTKEDFTKGDKRYDVILDNVGTQPLSGFRRTLKPQGICVMIGGGGPNDGGLIGPMARPIKTMLMSPFISQKMGMMLAEIRQGDLTKMSELMQAGKVTPVNDRTYPLSQIREAMKYLEAGHARGKVILTVEQENKT